MFRRFDFVVTVLLTVAAATGLHAQEPGARDRGAFQPYSEVLPNNLDSVLGRRVVVFVDFTCPHCRSVHASLRRWGAGLPNGYRMEVIPAIATESHIPMAIAYYAALAAAPERIEAFEEAMYAVIQDDRMPATNSRSFVAAARASGIDVGRFMSESRSSMVGKHVSRAAMVTNEYGVQEVPAVVVGNRYLTYPAIVQNDMGVFAALLNGLMTMRERTVDTKH